MATKNSGIKGKAGPSKNDKKTNGSGKTKLDAPGFSSDEVAEISQMEDMTPEQIEELRDAFNLFDHDGNGCISQSELFTVMQRLRQKASTAEITAMISEVDLDGNGMVDFHEFLRMMSRSRGQSKGPKLSEEDEMRQAFKVFDIDGNGLIDANELRLTMRNLGENLSKQDVKAMIKAADKNGDGKIDYEEFIKMMYNK